jgi:ribosomal protein L11 methyltransferase
MNKLISVQISGISNADDTEAITGLLHALEHEGMEEGDDFLKVCFTEEYFKEGGAEEILQLIKDRYSVVITDEILPDINWNEQWESSFEPVLVGDWAGIRASFHAPFENVVHEIVIDPKMSFGTGHHATTWQMLDLMRLVGFSDKKVLDLGCGTAVLAILAAKLGATRVTAIDNDPWCTENSEENCLLNNVTSVEIILGEAPVEEDHYDIILANINRNYLLENLGSLQKMLSPDGYLFISGFYAHEASMLLNKALEHRLIATYISDRENWCAIILNNKNVG